ncbi:DNA repair ATPase [Sphingomonas sp. AAP5]|uniref:P-loop ATPase, Sll1717 family n=1 Tax=Sphingomonas sp. AAP5 TaxID=1523415 RepID=UPI0010570026|nr:DNA repair ATPase [Sphingomonas sp. AAP5]QBM74383.1 DNA repair ATPase [Sphingomonas sp. AAP5]
MAKPQANVNPVVLRRGIGIGSGNAESDDDFLFDCFVQYPPVEACSRLTSPAMVVSGRTGAGKTAILRHIESTAEYTAVIDPFEMSMSYVSNSDALRFLEAIGADLDLLFQVLWKHVLCLEFIRLRWGIESTEKSQSIFARLVEQFSRDERKSKAISYLRQWQGRFWITMDQNIKEITEAVEKKLHAEVGGEIDKFKAGGQYDKRMSREKKTEIVARTRKIISSEQLSELHGVIDMLSISDGDGMKAFYIMIDRLDEKWVDDTVRFRMIKALMESLRSFRKIRNLKVLVALRADVLERVVQETADISFQREKFEDFTVKLIWSKGDLRRLVDSRLNILFKRRYTGSSVYFDDVFPPSMAGKSSFDWMIERTLMRPRDIIAFVNEAIDASDGLASVTVTTLRKAEVEFARKRKDALIQEWKSAFPTLDIILNFVTSRNKHSIELIELIDRVDDFCLSICSSAIQGKDPIHTLCSAYIEGKERDKIRIAQESLAVLYRTGAIGLKLTAQDRFNYAHLDQPLISAQLIGIDARVRLHSMLHAAFNLQERS